VKGLLILAIAVVVSIGGSIVYFRTATAPTSAMLDQPAGELEWLRREFQLSDEQFARVRAKHQEYAPKCERMCAQIADANKRLDELIKSNKAVTPEVEAALHHSAQVQEECRRAMLGHVYAVGGEMSPDHGARYLAMMKARLVQPGHTHRELFSEKGK
jgi:septal ring factor EnvC (AmiA/AmiB activator)